MNLYKLLKIVVEILYSYSGVSLVGNCRAHDLADFSFRSRSLQNYKFTLIDWPAFREVMKVARENHFGNLRNNRPLNDFIVRRSPPPNVCRQTSQKVSTSTISSLTNSFITVIHSKIKNYYGNYKIFKYSN